jgi:hypothetical protein
MTERDELGGVVGEDLEIAIGTTGAMPRPAMNSTRVATIGGMAKRVTSSPLVCLEA